MIIVITMDRQQYLKGYMKEINKTFSNIIDQYKWLDNIIKLVNGDIIKGYSYASRRDGLRADVAIGIDAEYLTCNSKIVNPIWSDKKLNEYLANIAKLTDNEEM